jgi:hypothetical protein
MRGQRGGPAGGRGCVAQRCRAIAGRLRVERHLGIVIAAESVQRRQDPRVDGAAPVGG